MSFPSALKNYTLVNPSYPSPILWFSPYSYSHHLSSFSYILGGNWSLKHVVSLQRSWWTDYFLSALILINIFPTYSQRVTVVVILMPWVLASNNNNNNHDHKCWFYFTRCEFETSEISLLNRELPLKSLNHLPDSTLTRCMLKILINPLS